MSRAAAGTELFQWQPANATAIKESGAISEQHGEKQTLLLKLTLKRNVDLQWTTGKAGFNLYTGEPR